MKRWRLFILLCALAGSPQAQAGILPSFRLEYSAWEATDILVVTASQPIDGHVKVLETWKGSLHAADPLFLPELAAFAPPTKRLVSSGLIFAVGGLGNDPQLTQYVTGRKLVLFLKRKPGQATEWEPASIFGGLDVSAAWIEQDKTYSFVQIMNPGPRVLVSLDLSPTDLKSKAGEVVRNQEDLARADSIDNPARRAQALRPFVGSPYLQAKEAALKSLGQCGNDALPVLRAALYDPALRSEHGEILEAFGAAGGRGVGPELTMFLASETAFWKQTAPTLQPGWWNGKGLAEWDEVEALRDRYSQTKAAVRTLGQIGFGGSRAVATELRDFWSSLPQLNDKSGLDQMSEECNQLLRSLDEAASVPVP